MMMAWLMAAAGIEFNSVASPVTESRKLGDDSEELDNLSLLSASSRNACTLSKQPRELKNDGTAESRCANGSVMSPMMVMAVKVVETVKPCEDPAPDARMAMPNVKTGASLDGVFAKLVSCDLGRQRGDTYQ